MFAYIYNMPVETLKSLTCQDFKRTSQQTSGQFLARAKDTISVNPVVVLLFVHWRLLDHYWKRKIPKVKYGYASLSYSRLHNIEYRMGHFELQFLVRGRGLAFQ